MHKQTIQRQAGFTAGLTVVVLLAIIAAGGIGFAAWHASQKPTASSAPAANTSPAATKTTAPNDQMAIKSAVVSYNSARQAAAGLGALEPGYQIDIQHQNASYALGTWSYPQDGGSSWFAQKNSDGSWQVVSQGQAGHCDKLSQHGLTSWSESCGQ